MKISDSDKRFLQFTKEMVRWLHDNNSGIHFNQDGLPTNRFYNEIPDILIEMMMKADREVQTVLVYMHHEYMRIIRKG